MMDISCCHRRVIAGCVDFSYVIHTFSSRAVRGGYSISWAS